MGASKNSYEFNKVNKLILVKVSLKNLNKDTFALQFKKVASSDHKLERSGLNLKRCEIKLSDNKQPRPTAERN